MHISIEVNVTVSASTWFGSEEIKTITHHEEINDFIPSNDGKPIHVGCFILNYVQCEAGHFQVFPEEYGVVKIKLRFTTPGSPRHTIMGLTGHEHWYRKTFDQFRGRQVNINNCSVYATPTREEIANLHAFLDKLRYREEATA